MSRPRICILSGQHPARNPRVVKEAGALAAAGADVLVLTLATHAASLALDAALAAADGWRLIYGVDLTRRHPAALWHRLRTRLARQRIARGGREHPAALGAVGPLLRVARRTPADLFIAHTECGLWAGRALARRGNRVATDLEDWHSRDLLPVDARARPLRLLRELEAFATRETVQCTTTSHALARALAQEFDSSPPRVLYNVFPLPESHAAERAPGDPPVLTWFSQTVGPGRGLESLADALAASARPLRLRLIGEASAEFRRAFAQRIGRAAVRLEWVGMVAPEALPRELALADIGCALELADLPSRDLTITNKVFQYLAAGLAVLATPTAGQREVAALAPDTIALAPGFDAAAIRHTLDPLLADRGALEQMKAAARMHAKARFCWERIAPEHTAALLRLCGR